MNLPIRKWVCPKCERVRDVDDSVLVGDEYRCRDCAKRYSEST